MAFWEFARQEVDIAIIETGLGGRLDSTNVICPEVALITNIGYDHMDLLGETLPEIAREKAGIIKPGVPVVISQRQAETTPVFEEVALANASELFFAEDAFEVKQAANGWQVRHKTENLTAQYTTGINGSYQQKNLAGVLETCRIINLKTDFRLPHEAIRSGLAKVVENTAIRGRWEWISTDRPKIICDVGHNMDGMKWVLQNIKATSFEQLHFIYGTVKDKEVLKLLHLLPKNAHYYFCQASVPRAMEANELSEKARTVGLNGTKFESVDAACQQAVEQAGLNDLIFIGGSTFVVAEIPEWLYYLGTDK